VRRLALLAVLVVVAGVLAEPPVAALAVMAAHTVPSAGPGSFLKVGPSRVVDTRTGLGGFTGPLGAGSTKRLTIGGAGGVPDSGVSAVALNITVNAPTRSGSLTVSATGTPRPELPSMYYTMDADTSQQTIVAISPGGFVNVFNGGTGPVQLTMDVSGYYVGGSAFVGGGLDPLTQQTVLDTRSGVGAPQQAVAAGTAVVFDGTDAGSLPPTGARAVVLNVAALTPAASGRLTAYTHGTARPGAPNVYFEATTATRPVPGASGLVVVPVGSDGKVDIYNGSAQPVEVTAALLGYVVGGGLARGGYEPVGPTRVVDTRSGLGGTTGPVAGGATMRATMGGEGGVPLSDVAAVLVNVVVFTPESTGRATVFTTGAGRPSTPNIAYSSGQTVSNQVLVRPDAQGRISIYNLSAGAEQIVVDVAGYYRTSTEWRITTPHLYSKSWRSDLSCSEVDSCVALGQGQSAGNDYTSLLRYDGTAWSGDGSGDVGTVFNDASCGSSFCVAVGYEVEISSDDNRNPVIATLRDGSWTFFHPLGTNPAQASSIRSVACAPSDVCIADTDYGILLSYAEGVWSETPKPGPSPENAGFSLRTDGEGEVADPDVARIGAPVDLPRAQCVGSVCRTFVRTSPGGSEIIPATFSDGAWTFGPALPKPPQTVGLSVDALRCGAAECFAEGVVYDGAAVRPVYYRLSGSSWAATTGPGVLFSTCADARRCAFDDQFATWNGSAWSYATLRAAPPGGSAPRAFSMSCPSARSCVVVGTYQTSSGADAAMISTLSDGRWTSQAPAFTPNDRSVLGTVTCVSGDQCLTVGGTYVNGGLLSGAVFGCSTADPRRRDPCSGREKPVTQVLLGPSEVAGCALCACPGWSWRRWNDARTSASASVRPTHSAPSTDLPGSSSL
jgi:hypothetical protein